MRTIVGNSTKNTKDIKKAERIVNLDPNSLPAPTNVSQYGAGGSDIKDLETAKHWASAAEKSAVKAETNADKAEDFFEKVVEAADEVLNNTEDSFNYLEEIRRTSLKIDGQEINIDEAEKQVILHTAASEAAAQIASDSASSARASEANAAASASSANNSAVSAKESEQKAKASEVAADLSATKADQKLAQTEAVYDKTIDDVSNAVQSYLKDKGGFDPSAGLPTPDSWLNIFGERKNLSCLWVAEKAGTVNGIGFNEGDVLLYNAIVDRYGRFSGELVTGGGGGGPTEFFNDIKLSAGKRILGTDSRGSTVELIKLVNDIVEAGDKTKPMHILAKDTKSAFVCVANATRGFDNYEIYHTGNKPTAADVGAHSKAEADAKFLDLAGTKAMSGPLNTTNTIFVKTKEVYHPGNKPPASDLDAVSLTKNETVSGRKKFTQNPIVEGISPQISLAESDTNTTVDVKVESKKLTMSTTTSTPFDVDFNNSSVLMSNPKTKTAQGTTADSLVRKDYADTEIAKKLSHTGNGTLAGDLIVKGKVTVEGTGSLFTDINTTGQVKENNIRVYSPANKPNAIDVGALPVSGGSVGGALHVVGNITTDATINATGNINADGIVMEKNSRVYSPNNKPTASAIGAVFNSSNAVTDPDNRTSRAVRYDPSDANPTNHHYAGITYGNNGNVTGHIMTHFTTGETYIRAYNSSWTPYAKVYTTRHKPTAADIGAIGIENVYDKTQADSRFWQRTETVNRSFSTDAVNSYGQTSAGSYKDTAGFRTYITSAGGTGFPAELGSGFFQGRLSGVNNYGWSMFNPVNSSHFYAGHQKADGSGFNWFKLYHEGNKPSAADINTYTKSEIDSKDNLKLNLTGGTVTGKLTAAQLYTTNHTLETGHSGSWDYVPPQGITRMQGPGGPHETTVYTGLSLGWQGYQDYGATIAFRNNNFMFRTLENKNWGSWNRLYHTGNKPTSADVGALPLTGGTVTGQTKFVAAYRGLISGSSVADSNGWPNDKNSDANNYINRSRFTVEAGNNGLHFVADGAFNSRRFGIQAGHSSEPYATAYGTLNLNPYGGTVAANGQTVYHAGNLLFSKTPDADKLVQRTDTGAIQASSFVSASDFRVTMTPKGGVYKGVSSVTGSIKITLPAAKTGTMMKLYVSVYDYRNDTSFDAVLSGYDYYSGDVQRWLNCSAIITGSASTTNHPVYFGQEDGKACIWIGSVGATWAYPHVVISKVETGYTGGNNDQWSSGWTVGFATTLGIVDRTISDCLIKPSDAANIADTEPTANTIVRRSGTGGGAFKGRVIVASSNDTDVAAGTASLDFTSASGNIYGQIGDVNSSQDIQVYATSGRVILNSNADVQVLKGSSAQRLLAGGLLASNAYADASKIPANGIYSKGDVTFDGFLNIGSSKLHVNGVNVIGTDANLVRIGDSDFARTMYLNAKNGEVNVRSTSSTAYRVYHEGFKPTAANVGALPITGGTLTGTSLKIPCTAALQGLSLIDGGTQLINLSTNYNGHGVLYVNSASDYTKNGIIFRALSATNTGVRDLFKVDMAGEIYAGGNQKVFHTGNLPSAGALNTYTKSEIDAKDNLKLNLTGGVLTGNVSITNSSGHLRVGGSTGGFTGVIGGKRQKKVGDVSSLDYGTYWSYDASVDDVGTWSAVRSSLGRKWVVDMGYHNDGFRVRTFTGDATTTWDDTAWDDILQATPTALTFRGNSVYHTGLKPTATDVGLSNYKNASSAAHGSVDISGGKGGYAGIHFSDFKRTLMINATISGVYKSDTSSWQWHFTNDTLASGKIPWARIPDAPATATRWPTAAEVGAAPTSHSHTSLSGNSYAGGGPELPNWFGSGKLTYRMLGQGGDKGGIPGSAYSDAVWVSSYTGGDVKGSNVLLFSKNGSPKIGFRQQAYDATAWGTFNEIYHTGFKPTAADVGALATSGGALTGKLSFGTSVSGVSSGNPSLYGFEVYGATNSTTSYGLNLLAPGSGGTWGTNIYAANQADRWIYFSQKTGTAGTMADYTVRAKIDAGTGEIYANGDKRVYHAGNKPTAADVGALEVGGTAAKVTINTTFSGKYPMIVNANGILYSHANVQFEGSTGTLTATRFAGNGASLTGITASQVGALASGGTAVAAAKLATARTIAGVAFDGTANISLNAGNVGAIPQNTTNGTPIASYYLDGSSSNSATGTKIRLPFAVNAGKMVSFTVRVYQGYSTADVQFSGYLYATPNQWHSPKAIMIAGSSSITAKMGRDTDGRAYVWLGGGNYRGVAVMEVVSGHSNANWTTGWEISVSNDTPNLALDTTCHAPYSPHNKPSAADVGALASGAKAADSDLLDGLDSTAFVRYGSGSYSQLLGKNASTSDWLRTTSNGLLPNADNSGSLGTSSWKFTQIHGVTMYENGASLSSKYLGISANAASATKLATPRAINGVNFDGSAAITITAAANGGTSAACSGNAATATKLATARTIAGVAFDGTANISISAGNVGTYTKAEIDSKDNTKLNLSGGTMTGHLAIKASSSSFQGMNIENTAAGWSYLQLKATTGTAHIAVNTNAIDGGTAGALHLRPAGQKNGSLIIQNNAVMRHQTATGYWEVGSQNASHCHYNTDRANHWFNKEIRVNGEIYCGASYAQRVYHTGYKPSAADVGLGSVNNTADSAKNVLSATKLTTARTIAGVAFDGTANISITASNVGAIATGGAAGSITVADRRSETTTTPDSLPSNTLRATFTDKESSPTGSWIGKISVKGWSSGYAAWELGSSSTTTTDGKLWFRSGVSGSWSSWDQVYTTRHKPSASDVGALASNGTAAAATKLATPRAINGVNFDGTAAITITAAANGGNAATATALQTARTIGGVSFNGTANIVPTDISPATSTSTSTFNLAWFSGTRIYHTNGKFTVRPSDGTLSTQGDLMAMGNVNFMSNLTVSGTIAGNGSKLTNLPVSGCYTGSDADLTNYPVGSYVFSTGWKAASLTRNSVSVLYISLSTSTAYRQTIISHNSLASDQYFRALSGTWVVRGRTAASGGNEFDWHSPTLFQRIA